MNTARAARAALKLRTSAFRAPLQKRTYADVAPDKIRLSLALPHQSIYKSQDVYVLIALPYLGRSIPFEHGEEGHAPWQRVMRREGMLMSG